MRRRSGALGAAAPGEADAVLRRGAGPVRVGTPSFQLLAGVAAAVDHLATLDPTPPAAGASRLRAGLAAAQAYEEGLFDRLLDRAGDLPAVTCPAAPARRCPTVSFRVDGQFPARTGEALGAAGHLRLRRRLLRLRVLPGDGAAGHRRGGPGQRLPLQHGRGGGPAAGRAGPAGRPAAGENGSGELPRRGRTPPSTASRSWSTTAWPGSPRTSRPARWWSSPTPRCDPAFEGKGVGAALARDALDQVRERGDRVVPQVPVHRRLHREASGVRRPADRPRTNSRPRRALPRRRQGRRAVSGRRRAAPAAARARRPGSRRTWRCGPPRSTSRAGPARPRRRPAGRRAGPATAARIQGCRCRSRTTSTSGRPAAAGGGSAGRSASRSRTAGGAGQQRRPAARRRPTGSPAPMAKLSAGGELDHVGGGGQRQRGRPGAGDPDRPPGGGQADGEPSAAPGPRRAAGAGGRGPGGELADPLAASASRSSGSSPASTAATIASRSWPAVVLVGVLAADADRVGARRPGRARWRRRSRTGRRRRRISMPSVTIRPWKPSSSRSRSAGSAG